MYSIAMNFFPENRESMSGYVESAGGCGLVTGPMIGTVLYAIGGYQFIFQSLGVLLIIGSLCIKFIMNSKVDGSFQDQESYDI